MYLCLSEHAPQNVEGQNLRTGGLAGEENDHLYGRCDRHDKIGCGRLVRPAEEVQCTGFAVD